MVNVSLRTTRVARNPESSDTIPYLKRLRSDNQICLAMLTNLTNQGKNGRTSQLNQLLNKSSKEYTRSRAHMQTKKMLNSSGNMHCFEISPKGLYFISFTNAGISFFQSKRFVPLNGIYMYMNQNYIYNENNGK